MSWLAILLGAWLAEAEPIRCPDEARRQGFQYGDGSSEEWCSDASGLRQGPYQAHYANDSVLAQGQYSSGRLDGRWDYFFNNGVKWREDDWRFGELESRWVNPLVHELSRDELLALGAAECGSVAGVELEDRGGQSDEPEQ
jgi:hypothetical protein